MKLPTGHLPNIHEVVGCPAEDEAQHQDARDLDGLDLGLPDDAGDAVPEDVLGLVGGAEAARPAVDDDGDGEVAAEHHQQRHQPRQAEHEHEVQKLLKTTIYFFGNFIFIFCVNPIYVKYLSEIHNPFHSLLKFNHIVVLNPYLHESIESIQMFLRQDLDDYKCVPRHLTSLILDLWPTK